MNKKALSILLIVSILMLSSCSEQVRHTEIDDDLEPSELTENTTPETSQATSETAENTGENWPADRYIPFVSGHGYSLVEEGYGTEVTDQYTQRSHKVNFKAPFLNEFVHHAMLNSICTNYIFYQGERGILWTIKNWH